MYEGPLFHSAEIPAPAGYENVLVRAVMNPGMDYPMVDVRGAVADLRVHLVHHGATHVRLNGSFDDLSFLEPSADLITRLWIGSAEVNDVRGLVALTSLQTLTVPPAEADEILPLLPQLRCLSLQGVHAWHVLAECTALRELLIGRNDLPDLTCLPELGLLEMLTLGMIARSRLVGIERFPSLRTLVFLANPALDTATSQHITDRFGISIADALQRWPSNTGMPAIRIVRLEADEGRAVRAAAAVPAVAAYQAPVTASEPACVVILIDRSASTEQQVGLDLRVIADADAAEHLMTTRYGQGPDGDVRIADAIAAAVNHFLRGLIARCTVDGENVQDVHVGIIDYGARVGPAWSGPLSGRMLVPVAEIAANPLRQSAGGSEWVLPEFGGETPLGDAFGCAHAVVAEWAQDHATSFPPVVINLCSGNPTGIDPVRDGWALRAVKTQGGAGLLFNVIREGRYGAPRFGVSGNLMSEREALFRMSSVMPPCIDDAARRAGYVLLDEPRGFFQDACAADFANLLHVFTALPGLPWLDRAIHHPLPPNVPTGWQVEQNALPGAPSARVMAEWKMPRLRGPMTEALFWSIIDKSGRQCDDSAERGDRIARMLGKLSEEDILGFEHLLDAALDRAYRWDLWAVAFIAKGGCSDDGFDYFCAWLVGQGRAYFEASLAKPEHAARRIAPGDEAEWEHLLSAAQDAYETKTGNADWIARAGSTPRGEPVGQSWDEADLPRLYARLMKKYA